MHSSRETREVVEILNALQQSTSTRFLFASGRTPALEARDTKRPHSANSTEHRSHDQQAGFLGGLAPVTSFNPLLQMPSGVHFSFFGSFVFGTSEFPLSDIPFQEIVDRVAAGKYQAKPARVFRFDDIQEAPRAMESNQANGKLVVRL